MGNLRPFRRRIAQQRLRGGSLSYSAHRRDQRRKQAAEQEQKRRRVDLPPRKAPPVQPVDDRKTIWRRLANRLRRP